MVETVGSFANDGDQKIRLIDIEELSNLVFLSRNLTPVCLDEMVSNLEVLDQI